MGKRGSGCKVDNFKADALSEGGSDGRISHEAIKVKILVGTKFK